MKKKTFCHLLLTLFLHFIVIALFNCFVERFMDISLSIHYETLLIAFEKQFQCGETE